MTDKKKTKNKNTKWIFIGIIGFILLLIIIPSGNKDFDKVRVMDDLEKQEIINNPYLYANNVDTDGDGLSDMVFLDNNKDGTVDFVAIDIHGDEILDSYFYDLDNSGKFELIKIDFDGDAKIDVIVNDLDEDGLPDTWDYGADNKIEAYDTDLDGYADSWDFDYDGVFDDFDKDYDGYPDNQTKLYGKEFFGTENNLVNTRPIDNTAQDSNILKDLNVYID